MTWEYVSGFFDGEGCIYTLPDHRRIRLDIAQRKSMEVLHRIQGFLADHQIRSRIIYDNHPTRVSRLRVGRSDDVTRFLEAMLPYLIVNRDKAVAALVILNKGQRRTHIPLRDLIIMRDLRDSGKSIADIARQTERPYGTVKHLLYKGQSIRGRRIIDDQIERASVFVIPSVAYGG